MEYWKDIKGYEGLYQVSNHGQVKNVRTGRILKLNLNKKTGYLNVSLRKNTISKNYYVHRLVAEAFIPNPNNYPCVNHKDENKTNNCVENLEWVTYQTNLTYKNAQTKRVEAFKKTCVKRHPLRNNKRSKPVLQYSLEGDFINEWQSAAEVERELGYHRACVAACCRHRVKYAYKHLWCYKGDELVIPEFSKIDLSTLRRTQLQQLSNNNKIPVVQFTINGEFIANYDSSKEAGIITGIDCSCIRKCCKNIPGYKTAGGFVWKYKNIA